MKRTGIAALVALGVAVGAPAGQAQPVAGNGPVAVAAKSCSAGYKRGIIGGAVKCLRRGEYCARSYASQYRRYGYRCTYVDANGRYHLQ